MPNLIDNLPQSPPKARPEDGLATRAREARDRVFDLSGTRRTLMCMLPFNSPTPEPDGAVRLCSASSTFGYARETNLGNAREDGLAAVWRGDKYRHIRKTLLTGQDLEPYCASCEYRFPGEAWMLQLHVALYAYHGGARDAELLGLIRRWAPRYAEYSEAALSHGLARQAMPALPPPGPGESEFNTTLPETLVDARTLPVYVDFNTLNRCNVSCTMCPPAVMHDDQHVPRETYYRLDEREFREICEGLNVKSAHFVGAYAEPMLNKDIFKLVKMAHDTGAFTAITTNASVLIPRFADRLLDAGLDMLTVSLHGATKATAEGIMRKANFERVISNIKALQAAKKARGITKPEIYFNFVSQRANVEEIPAFMDLAGELGVRHVFVIHLIDGGLADKTSNLVHHPHLLGPAIVEAKKRAVANGVNAHISPAYTQIVSDYEASLNQPAAG